MGYNASIIFFNSTPIATQSANELNADSVTLLNLSAAEDGLGGTFVWNADSVATADSLNVFQPSSVSGAGRWIRTSGGPAASSNSVMIRYATLTIPKATIIGVGVGQLGHANGVPIVATPGAGFALELLSGVVILGFATAAYTGGGNINFAYEAGGAALSATVSFANSIGGAADKIALVAASVPTNNQLVANKGINLVCAAAPTDPGTAAGVARIKLSYRVHITT